MEGARAMENIFEKYKDKYLDYVKKNKDILAVYLFGSYSDGTYHEKSDIDLGVVYYSEEKDHIDSHLIASVDAEKIFGNTPVDYVDLKSSNIFFRYKVFKTGKVIYCDNEDKLYEYIREHQGEAHCNNLDEEIIKEKLMYFNQQITKLENVSKLSKEEFLSDDMFLAATKYYLLTALRCAKTLVDNGHIKHEDLNTYKKICGLEGKLVHEYENVSDEIVYDIIHNDLEDFCKIKEE